MKRDGLGLDPGITQNRFQRLGHEIYGNRTGLSQNIGGNTNATNPSINTSTIRFNTGQGFSYDANGNVIQDVDPVTGHTRQFTFNGDNKQTQVNDTSINTTKGTYYYDGEGKRVKKVTETETTIFVYSAGKMVAEYSTANLPSNPAINYTTTDNLGTPRIITDDLGQVKARRDFMPFGEELFVNIGSRSSGQSYGSSTDNVRQKFTGYQKDTETSLDFAEARMYENRFGRFTAVDPLMASGKSANPQTFNRYVYVGNNPVKITDPTGMFGDYYSYSGEYLDTDGKKDGKVYFANLAKRDGKNTYVFTDSIKETTLSAVRNAVPLTPGNTVDIFQGLGSVVSQGVDAGTNGIAKGTVNFGIGVLNSLTNPLGIPGAVAGVPNPFAIAPVEYNNSLEREYGIATNYGLGAGTLTVGGALAAESSLSVVPEVSSGTRAGAFSEDLVKAAQELYPNKAGRFENHHIDPKYMGGDPSGTISRVDAAYHQVITNEFRNIHPYGAGTVNAARRLEIMTEVYRRFPLPSGFPFK